MCDEGNNRSVHIAHLLRYQGHDTLAVGTNTSTPETREMLSAWADRIILTDQRQGQAFPNATDLWPIPDDMPRPFNRAQHEIVRSYVARF